MRKAGLLVFNPRQSRQDPATRILEKASRRADNVRGSRREVSPCFFSLPSKIMPALLTRCCFPWWPRPAPNTRATWCRVTPGENPGSCASPLGANAHGKTKLIDALRFAQRLVVHGTKSGARIRSAPFRLDQERLGQPSRFDFLIDYHGVEYSYGFAVDAERVREEWLFARPGAREVRYFERLTDLSGQVTVEYGPELTGRGRKQRQFIEFVA